MVQGMYENLNQMGTIFGLEFVAQDRLSNSHSAILLGEYIHLHHPEQENGYHDAVFKAYFNEGKDIGQPEILSDLLKELGIAPKVLPTALNDHAVQTRMQENAQTAEANGVTGTPTFYIGNERVPSQRRSYQAFQYYAEGVLRFQNKHPFPSLLLLPQRKVSLTWFYLSRKYQPGSRKA